MKGLYKKIQLIFCIIGCAGIVSATVLTPIARVDVVPYQRISQGETFNFGVIAFSKNGIDRVEFDVSGQGYDGGKLVSNSMEYNDRTDVWEFWVPIKASNFSSSGKIDISIIVYGTEGGTRDLGTIPLIVDPNNSLTVYKAWVSNSGNDETGQVGNSSFPFKTVGAAASAAQTANGGSSDGNIIYFNEGIYNLGSGSIATTNEWITLAAADGAEKEKVIIDDGGSITNTSLIKVNGLTINSSSQYDYVFPKNSQVSLWVDNCRIVGFDRWIEFSGPINNFNTYYTDTYIYNVDRAVRGGGELARGLTIEHIGEDAFQNYPFVVNCTLNDQDPGNTQWHADSYQSWGDGPVNRIIYNFRVTDAHYQGIFMRATNSIARNNAFVNIFVEMRGPGRDGGSGKLVFTNGAMYGPWDHVLVWHCTFPSSHFAINSDTAGEGFTNASFIGNLFYEYRDNVTQGSVDPEYAAPGNSEGNEFIFNHFIWSCVDQGNCSSSEPQYFSKSPDSDSNGSQSVGDPMIDLKDTVNYVDFGMPMEGSPLINKINFNTVPADIFGNLRDASPDIGAIESESGSLISVIGVNISPDSLTINVMQISELTDSVIPSNASNKNVLWSSSNTSVAKVDDNGEVTAVNEGAAVITAKTVEGEYTDSCVVTVTNYNIPVITVVIFPNKLNLAIQESASLSGTVIPYYASDKSVSWSTSDESVAIVDNSGKVTAIDQGNAYIIVTTDNGSFADTCAVTVVEPFISEDFSVDASNFTVVAGGDWSADNGHYVLVSSATGGEGLMGNISIHNTEVTGDFKLSTLINITGTTSTWNDAAVLFNYRDNSNYYYVSLNESNDGFTQGLFKVADGVSTELCDITTPIYSDTDYLLSITFTDGEIVVTLDGEQIATATDASIAGGNVGYGSKNDAAQFDNLIVITPATTGTTKFKTAEKIRVFPNPVYAGRELTINLNQNRNIQEVGIYDFNGRMIFSEKEINKNVIQLPTGIIPGLYIIKVHSFNATENLKLIIKQHIR